MAAERGEARGNCPTLVIETHQLTKLFRDRKRGEVRAVDGINLRCEPGQIYGLLGAKPKSRRSARE
jgi:ABC-type glutathione transport system ATPase component